MESSGIGDVIRQMLEAEGKAKDIAEHSEAEARDLVAKAREEARVLLEEAKHRTAADAQALKQCILDEAGRERDERIARAVKEDERGLERSKGRSPAAVDLIVRLIAAPEE